MLGTICRRGAAYCQSISTFKRDIMFLVDWHCHLDGLDYQSLHKDVDDVMAKAAARDVRFALAVATTLPGYPEMRELVGEREVVFSCGVHPLNQDEPYDVKICVYGGGRGRCGDGGNGLDYFHTPETKSQQQLLSPTYPDWPRAE
ncbi:TatD family hydrolase [Shigella flexneri]